MFIQFAFEGSILGLHVYENTRLRPRAPHKACIVAIPQPGKNTEPEPEHSGVMRAAPRHWAMPPVSLVKHGETL